jgi:hypothetical protein
MTSLRDSDAPAFREPWQAKAFAMVVLLHRQGRFEWDEWVRVLPIIGNSSPRLSGSSPHWALPTQTTSGNAKRTGTAPTSIRRTAMQSSWPPHAPHRAMQTITTKKPAARLNYMAWLRSFGR